MKEAFILDAINGNTYGAHAIVKEIKSARVAVRILPEGGKHSKGFL